MHTDADEVEAPLVATGPGEVKAKDIVPNFGAEIDRGSDRDPALAGPRSSAGLTRSRGAERTDAASQEAQQAEPQRRAPPRQCPVRPLQAADRAQPDQDQPGEGEGGQARGREVDHPRQTGRPPRPSPGPGDPAQRQVHRPQALRGSGATLQRAARRLHQDREVGSEEIGLDRDGLLELV